MQITIEKSKPLPKSIAFTAGGKEYLGKKDCGIAVGMTIDAEIEANEYNGKTYHWIKTWKAVSAPASAPAATTPAAPTSSNGAGYAWLPFASNTVAHAINAGLITSPEQVKIWAASAKRAFQELA